MNENEENKELLDELKFKKNMESFDALLDKFNDYLFKIYAVGYIKTSIQRGSMDLKSSIFEQIKKNSEELTLNSDSNNFNEDQINNLQDNNINIIGTITGKSKDFKDIITDEELLGSIKSLSDKQKEILFLLFLQGLDEKSIADRNNVSVQSVNKIKLKALNRLRADRSCKHGQCN
jgi:RNA polymerase sigma factor (sigma-70 family)